MKQCLGKRAFAKLISILKNVFFLSQSLSVFGGKLFIINEYSRSNLKARKSIVKGTIKLYFLVLRPMATSSLLGLCSFIIRETRIIFILWQLGFVFSYTVCRYYFGSLELTSGRKKLLTSAFWRTSSSFIKLIQLLHIVPYIALRIH